VLRCVGDRAKKPDMDSSARTGRQWRAVSENGERLREPLEQSRRKRASGTFTGEDRRFMDNNHKQPTTFPIDPGSWPGVTREQPICHPELDSGSIRVLMESGDMLSGGLT